MSLRRFHASLGLSPWAQLGAMAVLALALTALLWLVMGGRGQLALRPGDLGQGDYQLATTTGASFTAEALKGAPSLVFFGFTHCPDVCPTTLSDIALWQDELGEAAAGLRVFFITVDPARDSVAALTDYVSWLPGAVGVTGPQAEVDKAIRSFRIFARKMALSGDDYTMDHSTSILLFDAAGQLTGTIAYQAPLAEAVQQLRGLVAG